MKCLGMGGHDPSRLVCHWQDGDGGRVGYDRLAVGGPLSRVVDKAWATDPIRLGGDGLLDRRIQEFHARTSASSVESLASSGPSGTNPPASLG
jgi:hypothetical protein